MADYKTPKGRYDLYRKLHGSAPPSDLVLRVETPEERVRKRIEELEKRLAKLTASAPLAEELAEIVELLDEGSKLKGGK